MINHTWKLWNIFIVLKNTSRLGSYFFVLLLNGFFRFFLKGEFLEFFVVPSFLWNFLKFPKFLNFLVIFLARFLNQIRQKMIRGHHGRVKCFWLKLSWNEQNRTNAWAGWSSIFLNDPFLFNKNHLHSS